MSHRLFLAAYLRAGLSAQLEVRLEAPLTFYSTASTASETPPLLLSLLLSWSLLNNKYTSFTGTPVFGTGVDPDNMEATVADIIYDSVYGDATDSAPLPAPYPNSSSTI